MSDPLLDAVKALREGTDGEERAIGQYTRSRVLSAVRQQSRRRVVNLAFGIPLAAILIGSGAWAASGQSFPGFVQRVTVALGLHEPAPAQPVSPPAKPARAKSPPTSPTEESGIEHGLKSDSDAGSSIAVSPVSSASSTDAPKHEPVPGVPAIASNSKSVARDNHLTEQELALYEVAHQAHFVAKDPSAAFAAWSEYLRQMPRGRFAVEASYNRALCLVRLGRKSEAKLALEPFARGAYGSYRRDEAAALLGQLSAP